MTAFIPTTVGYILPRADSFDVTGERQYGAPIKVGLSVVQVAENEQQTSVRADTSGSKSFADENVELGRALIHPRVIPKMKDLLKVGQETFEIYGVRSIYDMYGKIDHYQAELKTWA